MLDFFYPYPHLERDRTPPPLFFGDAYSLWIGVLLSIGKGGIVKEDPMDP